MPNMSYCRFENTLNAVRDCHEALWGPVDKMNEHEKVARLSFLALVVTMAEEIADHTPDDIANGIPELRDDEQDDD